LLAAGLLTAALFAAGGAAPGRADDGISVTRAVSAFDKVRTEGAFETDITAGAATTRVVVRGSRDVVDRVTTEVKDATLVVGVRAGTNWFQRAPAVTIDVPVLHSFANAGAGSVKIRGLAGGAVSLENDGAATIAAAGRAASVSISLNGTGKIDTTALDARDATVDNNGVGSVRVRASGSLTASVNGVGDIRYAGKPAHVESQVNGLGRIGPL
jgi:hypothetical protein